MVMLSQLLRFTINDEQGRQARLTDLSVALLESDHPRVTCLYFTDENRRKRSIAWEEVRAIDWEERVIKVDDLGEADKESKESMAKAVLLSAGILDALVLDLQNRRATRANDLLLEEQDHKLLLRAADTGLGAIARRLTRGLFGPVAESALLDWKYVEFLRGDPGAVGSEAGQHLRISRLPPGEIARLTDALPYLHAAELLTLIADPKAADTLEKMSPERQLQVFEELDEKQAVRLLELMAPDIATDLLARLHPQTMRRYVERLPAMQAERILELLRYPEDTVGAIMTNEVVYICGDLTVATARSKLRGQLKSPDFVYFVYIVDDEESRRLRGAISIRDLITAPDEKKLEEIMDPYLITLQPLEPADASAHRVLDSHLAALPVVGNDKRLVGVVTVDAAVSQVAPRSWSAQAPRIFS
ncbi:MAG: CBS domain-containing protein [Pyrinomonadaceae bacterium]